MTWLRLLGVVGLTALALAVGALAGGGGLQLAGAPLLVVCAALAMGVNLTVFIPAWLLRSERFYDLTGSLTYLSVLTLAVVVAAGSDALGWRAVLAAVCVAVWALRLGLFLFSRIRKDGKDGRFDTIKEDFGRFAVAWALQGLWVFLTVLAVLVLICVGGNDATPRPTDLGFILWAAGFAIEVAADRQKSAFRAEHPGRFVNVGLWAWSRHPNYFGEICLWTGLFIVAAGHLEGLQWLAVLSPLFVTLLLTRVSGIPMVDDRADKRWGDQPDYQAYKANTPLLLLWPPRR